jgi:hypothetical protein
MAKTSTSLSQLRRPKTVLTKPQVQHISKSEEKNTNACQQQAEEISQAWVIMFFASLLPEIGLSHL